MIHEAILHLIFPGFADFRSNVTFVPIQFFTVVIPNSSLGTIRIVGYMLRKVLGWVDEHGDPTCERLAFSYEELVNKAGVSRSAVVDAIEEAVEGRFLRRLPPAKGQNGRNQVEGAVYTLCWDSADQITHDPAKFAGFYYPEAMVVEERNGNQVVRRPKAARKNIPNAYFDYLLPRERRSVVRVVGALLFRSIQWGLGGERRVPVSCSITELSRLTQTTRTHVHAALMSACQHGYIQRDDAGCFDPAAGRASRTATYSIRWTKDKAAAKNAVSTPAVEPASAEGDDSQYKKENGPSVQKRERSQYKNDNGKECKKVNGINIETELKTEHKTTAVGAVPPESPASDPAADAFNALVRAGFDAPTARLLAGRHASEVIERQLEWLPLRGVTRNRLGLLRRAIEQNWPRPQGSATELTEAARRQGRLFASQYYAAYHGYAGEAAIEPFPKDVALAAQFVEQLAAQGHPESAVPELGRQFGRFMRARQQNDAHAKPSLCLALVPFGYAFLAQLKQAGAARRTEALGKARAGHEATFQPAYHVYLSQSEKALQQANPALYEAFVEERQRLRALLFRGPFMRAAALQESYDSEAARILGFAEFFARHLQHHVLTFWEWDQQLNPRRFTGAPARTQAEEARP